MSIASWWKEFTKPDPEIEMQVARYQVHKGAGYLISAYDHMVRSGRNMRNFIVSDWTVKSHTDGYWQVSLHFIGRRMVEGDL